jgi:hypothetical protein
LFCPKYCADTVEALATVHAAMMAGTAARRKVANFM